MSRDLLQSPNLNTPKAHTAKEWLDRAMGLVNSQNFTKEDSARFDAYMDLFAAARQSSFDREVYNEVRAKHDAGLRFDPATLAFFSGQRPDEPIVSENGGRLASCSAARSDRMGAVTELRSYAALSTTPGTSGGYSIPTGFLAEVLAVMRQYDQLLDASRWIFTPTGNAMNTPSVDDTSTSIDAVTLAENSLIAQGPNPIFSNIGGGFPQATTWVTPQFLYSLQIEQDSPVLASYFADLFAKSFARGMGKSFLSTLLGELSAGQTTSSTSAIAMSEIYGLVGSIDTAYAAAPGAGWLMTWKTLLAIRQITTTGGQLAFPHELTADGRPAILGKPVYLCPNMSEIGAGNVVSVFGDLKRHGIRAVTDSFTAFRYDEKYMPNHQKAIQSFWRADSLLMVGSNSDAPMKTLVMHS